LKVQLPASIGFGVGVAAVAAIALAGVGFWLYKNREWFNPASQNNLANQGASAAITALTGGAAAGGEDSLGGLFARAREWLSGDDAAIEAMKAGAPARSPLGADDPGPTSYSPFNVGA
jgi:hypothetical protein